MSLTSNQQKLIEFEFGDSPIPFDMTDVVLQVVYRGELGSEADAVAVGTIDMSEPTYFAYHNASDYIHIGQHVYSRGQVEARHSICCRRCSRSSASTTGNRRHTSSKDASYPFPARPGGEFRRLAKPDRARSRACRITASSDSPI